jgi:hypothetical protein
VNSFRSASTSCSARPSGFERLAELDPRRSKAPARRSPARKPAQTTRLQAGFRGEAHAGPAGNRRGGPLAVSTTLTRLAKSGEVQKVERGYRLAPAE